MRNLQLSRATRVTSLALSSLIGIGIGGGCAADRQTRDSLNAANTALDQKQYDQTIGIADQQIQHAPNGTGAAEAWYLKGSALEQRASQTPAESKQNIAAAREAYVQGLGAVAKERNPSLEARLHSGVANTSYWMEDYTTAMSEWTAAYQGLDDANAKGLALYRIGVCQQRLGRFDQADQTFATVLQQFPNSEVAARAKQRQGARNFSVQLATFASPNSAEATTANLRKEGAPASKAVNAQGNAVVMVGPFQTYTQAQAAKSRFAGTFPDAMIVP
jgi:tetratricopeptide (TPR) repeat protein